MKTSIRSVLSTATAASAFLCGSQLVAADPGWISVRGGLVNFPLALPPTPSGGDRQLISYFGGGSMARVGASQAGKAYSARLHRALHKAFPKHKLVEYNKALARTNSWVGACRTPTNVIRHYIALKLVVIDFAADDYGMPETRVKAALEGIVRQIRTRHKHADILFLYSLRKEFMKDFAAGKTPDVITWHETVASHYNIPSINMARFAAERIAAGKLTLEAVLKDGLHPTDKGHEVYAAAVQPFIDQCKAAPPPAELVAHPLPAPLTPRPMEKARLVSYEKGELETGWLGWQESPVALFFHVVRCNEPGPVLSMRFKGASIGYFDVLGPDSGDLEFSLDGSEWRTKSNFDAFAKTGYRPHAGLLAENLDPTQEHVVTLRVAPTVPDGSKGRWSRIAEFLIDGSVIYEDPYKGKNTLEQIDAIWTKMEPVTYMPPPKRWKQLPRTMKKLQQGPELRIVMLGDSIVNDTAHSHFEHLLMRRYPNCNVHKKVSVRGSTGCWWYKEKGRVQEYVLDHTPDIVMIGGISQRNDIDSIRSVIHQVREALPNTEFLLMTGPFGNYDPREDPKWRSDIDPESDSYNAKLMKLAVEENCEFFDIRGAWGDYVRASQWALGAFKRDRVHANNRGKQILGRLLEVYLAPGK